MMTDKINDKINKPGLQRFVPARSINEQSKWYDLTPGAEIYEPGTSRQVMTGEWRVLTPKFEADKCKQCMLCVPFCPDVAIPVRGGVRLETELNYCKGCGICARVCSFGAITMEEGNA